MAAEVAAPSNTARLIATPTPQVLGSCYWPCRNALMLNGDARALSTPDAWSNAPQGGRGDSQSHLRSSGRFHKEPHRRTCGRRCIRTSRSSRPANLVAGRNRTARSSALTQASGSNTRNFPSVFSFPIASLTVYSPAATTNGMNSKSCPLSLRRCHSSGVRSQVTRL